MSLHVQMTEQNTLALVSVKQAKSSQCVCLNEYAAMGVFSTGERENIGLEKMQVDDLACATSFTIPDSDCSVLARLKGDPNPTSSKTGGIPDCNSKGTNFIFAVAELSHILNGEKKSRMGHKVLI